MASEQSQPYQKDGRESLLQDLDRWRHRIPFWWWLTYDALVAVVILLGISPSDPAYWLGFAVLAIAVVIDAVEFYVKRPASVAKLSVEPDHLVVTTEARDAEEAHKARIEAWHDGY